MERRSALIIGVTIVGFVGLILYWASSSGPPALPANLTEVTAKNEIDSRIELSHLSIATGENYFGHKVRVISGYLKNVSDKPVRLVEMKMVFTDYDGKPIQESVEHGHELKQKPLEPGAQHRFEVNFENLPRTWNYHVPNVEIVKIVF